MKFKQRLNRLNEANLETRLLKAISNIPTHEIQDYDFVSGIFNFVDSMYVKAYEDTTDWLSNGDCGAEDAFWVGVSSGKYAPSNSDEPILYDAYNGIAYGLKNKAFSGKVLVQCLKDSGFDIYDEDEALEFIERYE